MRIKNQPIAENIMAASSSHGSYSFALALADLIDNSITAKANLVDIGFFARRRHRKGLKGIDHRRWKRNDIRRTC